MKPIRFKMIPLAHNLKDKVKKALTEREASGIKRKSFSEWSSVLRVVHKWDGSIRIMVDYKPLNKVIKHDRYQFSKIAELYKILSESDIFFVYDYCEDWPQGRVPSDIRRILVNLINSIYMWFQHLRILVNANGN